MTGAAVGRLGRVLLVAFAVAACQPAGLSDVERFWCVQHPNSVASAALSQDQPILALELQTGKAGDPGVRWGDRYVRACQTAFGAR